MSKLSEQEPVAWALHTKCVGEFVERDKKKADEFNDFFNDGLDCHATVTPLYTKPQPLRRLSDGEIDDLIHPLIKDIPMPLVNKVFTIMRKSANAIQDAIEKLNNGGHHGN